MIFFCSRRFLVCTAFQLLNYARQEKPLHVLELCLLDHSNIADELGYPSTTGVRKTAGNGLHGLLEVWQFGPE